ncbi:putative CENP-V/GFA domain-containing protein [Seiridium cardinale]|uniref:CENP-V/GFA domain-containing protein n=1 Tax=Seiridium cardinale TaxID=138064 RepID=A0ABR2XGQ6_9PEZI
MSGLEKPAGKDDALPEQKPFASTPQPLTASCHCGRVTLEIPSKPQDICECRCSICYRYGALWAYYKRGQVTVTVSAEPAPGVSQQSYVRTDEGADGDIGFFWCGHCGCMTHWWKMGQDGPLDDAEAKMGVNSRMLPKHLVEIARRSIVVC